MFMQLPNPAQHPEVDPPESEKGLPRLVLEARCHLGPDATPETVVVELRNHGVETTPDEVRKVWPEGGNPV